MAAIRKASLSDVDELVEIWKRFMEQQRELGRIDGKDMLPEMKEDAPEMARTYLARNVRSRKALLLVLEDNNSLQGYMLNTIEKNIPVFVGDRVGFLSAIYLEGPYRGKGYGGEMFKIAREWFRELS